MKIYNFNGTGQGHTKSRSSKILGKILFYLKTGNWFTWAFRIAAAGVLLVAFLFIYYSRSLPDPNRLLGRNVPESTKIYAADGSMLYEVHGEIKRTLVNLDQISPDLKHATIAAEDKNFYKHAGVSVMGLARSVIVDIIHMQKKQGGSTITQQFVKNAVLTRDKSFTRKIKEIIIAIELEARFSKDDILKLYLNEIPYGRNAYGIEAASQTYFNKHANELSLAESAYLAALPQAPSYYNPSGPNFDALQARQKNILKLMEEEGYITADQHEQALNEEVAFQTVKTAIVAPHFVQYVEDYLGQKYGESTLQEGGLKVYTTLDPKLQAIAEKAVTDGAAKNISAGGYNAALVAMNPKNGYILAMVGSKDYFGESQPKGCVPGKSCLFEPNVNVATTLQQPGSSFKPYAYVTAFGPDFKYSPASMLVDVVTNFGGGYTPQNFNLGQNGPVSMRKALAGSLNIPAVKTIALVGADNVVKTARDLGITAPLKDCGLALVLGGCDVKLIDHTAAYATLANGGVKVDKTAILKVESKEGQVLEVHEEKKTQVLDPRAVYQLIDIMTDNSARAYVFGANSALTLKDRLVAAKTGTTQDFRDGWTMGFTPSLVAGVWTGNNNNAPMKRDAVQTAGPIWNQFMREALAGTPVEKFEEPEGIKHIAVDSVTGKLPTQYSPSTKTETFADYNAPTKYDDLHIGIKIDSSTGQPATDSTPEELIVTEIYQDLHSERPKDPNWENPVIAWALANSYKYPPGSGVNNNQSQNQTSVSFASPQNDAIIKQLPISISLGTPQDTTKVEILLDNQLVKTLTSSPYNTTLGQSIGDGNHTLTAKAYLQSGQTVTSSINIKVAITADLVITTPDSGLTVQFPLTIEADSSTLFGSVTFWYQGSSGSAKQIGAAEISDIGGNYRYSISWDSPPKSGKYSVYAKSNTGVTSSKISITVP